MRYNYSRRFNKSGHTSFCPVKRTNVTIQDVAIRSAVSKATVSLVMNGRPGIKPETVERVMEVARELGFTPNAAARRLGSSTSRGTRTMTIGFLTGHPVASNGPDPFHFHVMLGVQRAARALSYHVLLSVNPESPAEQLDYIRSLSNDGVDGWVLADGVQPSVIDFVREHQIPAVIAGDSAFFPGVTSVHGDSIGGAGLATQHLLDLGHRRIGFVGGEAGRSWSSMRLAGYLGTLGQAGIVPDEKFILSASSAGECGLWFKHLLDREELPSAIFAATDSLAVELVKAATRHGRTVPDDISICGFDDSPYLAPVMNPSLTTVRVPMEEIGETAFRCLYDEIQGRGRIGSRLALPVDLVVRESTAPRVFSGRSE